MLHIILPDRWKQQPTYSVEIDWRHPSAANLNAAYCSTVRNRELVFGTQLLDALGANLKPRGTARGIGWYRDAPNAVGYVTPSAATRNRYEPLAGDLTIAAFGVQQDFEANNSMFYCRGNGSSNPAWGIGVNGGSTDGITAYWYIGATQGDILASSLSFPVLNRHRLVSLTFDAANITARADKVGSASVARPVGDFTYQFDSSYGRTMAMGAANGGFNAHNTTLASFQWLRALPDGELRALSEAPYQLFRRAVHRTYFFPPQRPEKKPVVLAPVGRRERVRNRVPVIDFGGFGRGAVGAVMGDAAYDLVKRDLKWAQASSSLSSGRYDTTPRLNWRVQPPVTFVCSFVPTKNFAATTDIASVYNAIWFEARYGAARRMQIVTTGTSFDYTSGNNWTLGRRNVYVGTADGSTASFYVDGRLENSAACTGTINYSTTGYSAVQAQLDAGVIEYIALLNRVMSPAEVAALSANPMALFRRDLARSYFYPRPMQPRRVWTLAPERLGRTRQT